MPNECSWKEMHGSGRASEGGRWQGSSARRKEFESGSVSGAVSGEVVGQLLL